MLTHVFHQSCPQLGELTPNGSVSVQCTVYTHGSPPGVLCPNLSIRLNSHPGYQYTLINHNMSMNNVYFVSCHRLHNGIHIEKKCWVSTAAQRPPDGQGCFHLGLQQCRYNDDMSYDIGASCIGRQPTPGQWKQQTANKLHKSCNLNFVSYVLFSQLTL